MTDTARLATARPIPSPALRIVLAACLVAAGAIHLAMVPSHADEWLAEGIAFAVAGWLQVLIAAVVILRPSRAALVVAVLANAIFIGAWIWTRTAGPPFGPEEGARHATGFVDITCVALEAAAIVVGLVALLAPYLGVRVSRGWYAVPGVVAFGILVLASTAIVSPSATEHAHAEGTAGHSHGGAADTVSADGHAHGTDGAMSATVPVDDKGLALLSNGEMAHHHYAPDQPLDANTRAALVHQLALTRLVADRFPTLGDAKAAGSTPAGGFNPGLGIHMSLPKTGLPDVPPPDPSAQTIPGTLTDDQVLRPSNLLYAGSSDDAKLAGFMYYSFSPTEPEGFAGPNDHWHTHGALCVTMAGGKIGVLHPDKPTKKACTAEGGIFVARTNWMVHVWTVPGYESNRGVFSDVNPSITCPDGTYYQVTLKQAEKYQVNKCRSNPQ
jgi:hypothetical protein